MIYRCYAWPTNADLIADVHVLGYLRDADLILDPTYGRGGWWKRWKPDGLVAKDRKTDPSWDFRDMTCCNDGTYDAVAFDPAYVCTGGRKTVGPQAEDFVDRYGMTGAAPTPEGVQEDINRGIAQSFRVLKPGGVLCVKCSDYVSSGELWPGTHFTWAWATMGVGFEHEDTFVHLSKKGGMQPRTRGGRPVRQVHARSNSSTLFVFRKPK